MSTLPVAPLKIARVAIAIPAYKLFDYQVPESLYNEPLQVGMRLKVPFGPRQKVGVLLEIDDQTEVAHEKLKPITAILDTEALLSEHDIRLMHWASQYYYHPLGEVFSAAFPVSMRKGKAGIPKTPLAFRITEAGRHFDAESLKNAPKQRQLLAIFQAEPEQTRTERDFGELSKSWQPTLKALISKGLIGIDAGYPVIEIPKQTQQALSANAEQQAAISEVCAHLEMFRVYLLEGVTGSGKTEVYMQIIQSVLDAGKQALVLLPEITLTPQLESRFQQRFDVALVVSHSKLTDTQRHSAWMQMQQGTGKIMLGTRSALFTPLKNPGVIILDEEHDSSFKQQEGFRFSARDIAIMRAKHLQIPIVLGTATPSLESLENALQGRYQRLHLTQRAGQASDPRFLILDIRNKKLQEGLSPSLVQAIADTLAKDEQVLIFLNRRGFAPVLICHSCGWVARCRHCDANLVIHYEDRQLICHHCSAVHPLLQVCPGCQKPELMPLGLGTERVEKLLSQLFPEKRTLRLDRDTTQAKGALEGYLEQIHQAEVDIILGTQMLAKGHHFPNVTLVAMLDVDSGLFSVDYHAPEKLAQLIMQVAGRAGREQKPGRVILQTRQPDHPLLKTLIKEGYHSFAQMALAERREARLPPFSHHALLRAVAVDSKAPFNFLSAVSEFVRSIPASELLLMGPVPAPMLRRAGKYRYQLLFQADSRARLRFVLDKLVPQLDALPGANKVHWTLDIDPIDLY